VTTGTTAQNLKNMAEAQAFLDQVWHLTKLLLVVSATSASFFATHQLKNVLVSYDGPANNEQFAGTRTEPTS